MRQLSNSTRSISDSQISRADGDITEAFTGKRFYKELITKANTVPLERLFKHYGLHIDSNNKKAVCPFPSHNGGRERTPSFWYYPNTNTFWCFGCKTGITCCDFVAAMDKSNKVKAGYKILDLFSSDVDDDRIILDTNDFNKRLDILMNFSSTVRSFRKNYADYKSQIFIEDICMVFDTINIKHNLNNEALYSVFLQLKDRIDAYEQSMK
jgi:hypothetical protein